MAKRILITGGPGTGKTVLVRELENNGYHCFHEIIREMTQSVREAQGPENSLTNPLAFVTDPWKFNKTLLEQRIAQYRSARYSQDPFVFYDRGMPDVLAYMDYFGQAYDGEFSTPCAEMKYDLVFLLPPWKEIYTQDAERLERFEQACEIHDHLERTYRKFDYEVLPLDTGPLGKRMHKLLRKVEEYYG